jgi:VCBS repeat-containing protein
VKTISIKQLLAETGRWVRAATKQTIVVTDRGERIATLQSHDATAQTRLVFTLKGRGSRPKIAVDSTASISEDRDRS